MPVNYRYDEFLDVDQSVLITGEAVVVPSGSPYYVALKEIPKESFPSTLLVRAAGSSNQINPDQDCSVQSNNTSLNDNGASLYFGKNLGSGGELRRSFVRFDITALPSVAASAKLRLYVTGGNAATAVGVHQLTSAFTETGPTWAAQPTYNPVAASQFNVPAQVPNNPSFTDWIECDVTALYNAWKAGTNYGLMLRADESIADSLASAYSRASSPYAPQLVVVSAGNVLVEVSATIAPGPMEFAVHYGTGRLRFNAADAGDSLEADYRGTGSPVDASHVVVDGGTTAGTSTAYTATAAAITQLARGQLLALKMHTANGGATTLALNGGSAIAVQRFTSALTGGQLAANATYLFFYDGTWQWIG